MRRYKRLRRMRRLTHHQRLVIRNARRLQQIVEAVSRASGIDVPTLRSHYVHSTYVDARFAIIRLARRECIPLPQIGRALGGRDHTTILHGIRRGEQLVAGDHWRGRHIAAIEAEATRILAGVAPPEMPAAEPEPEPPAPAPVALPPPQRRHGHVDRFGQIICNP